MKFLTILYFLLFVALVANVNCSWLTACKPCVSQLQFCLSKQITGSAYVTCIESIEYSNCETCVTSVAKTNNLYCDASIEYHNLSCQVSCRLKGILNVGYCDKKLKSEILINCNCEREARSWILACKPCVPQLEYCLKNKVYLTGSDFKKCIDSITYSSCQNCVINIENSDDIWCDQSIEYHNLVCQVSCRLRGFLHRGVCDSTSALCTCNR
ncbi:unnamed protein product [Brachionus calyciflorus]|uniref:Uncharacterized protein n=1 Tax=Brachionus calyciflorus TaxID=104777 RepID=A0A814GVV6_9BILA|nr:unnamed protein product [Brachionus calyciflorus]